MDQNKTVCPIFNYRPDSIPCVKINATFPFKRRSLENPTIDRPYVFKATGNPAASVSLKGDSPASALGKDFTDYWLKVGTKRF